MMPSPATFQTVSGAWRSAISYQMQRSCPEAMAAKAPPCKAWSPLVGVSRRGLACRALSTHQRTSGSSERVVSGDNAVTVLPDDGKAAAVIRVYDPADDQVAQSQQFGSPAATDAAHLNSGARQRRREQRAEVRLQSSTCDAARGASRPPPCRAPEGLLAVAPSKQLSWVRCMVTNTSTCLWTKPQVYAQARNFHRMPLPSTRHVA